MNICWKLYFQTLKLVQLIVFLSGHLHSTEHICVFSHLFLKFALLGFKNVSVFLHIKLNIQLVADTTGTLPVPSLFSYYWSHVEPLSEFSECRN